MNNRLNKTIEEMKEKKKKALVAFLTAGYPNLKATEEMVLLLEKNGIDPDYKIELTEKDSENGKDPQLDKAIEILKTML